MVIDDLYLLGTIFSPREADPILTVDSDAVLTSAISRERFEAVAGRRTQVGDPGCGIEHVQLAERHGFDCLEFLNCLTPEQRFGSLILGRPDHRFKM